MNETTETVVDEAGLERTATGDLTGKTGAPTTESKTTETTTTDRPSGKDQSLLNEEKDDGGEKKEAAKEPPKAPDKYEDFKVPDGYELDKEVAAEAGTLFKELGLPQEAAQKLVDFYVKESQKAFQQPFDAYQQMRADWRKEAEAHPDLKGRLNGGEKAEVRVAFAKLLNQLDDAGLSQDFREAMDLTGAGDHPAFIRVMYKLSQMLTEGSHVTGKGPVAVSAPRQQISAARALYPNLPSSAQS